MIRRRYDCVNLFPPWPPSALSTPPAGIGGTPYADRATGRLYVVVNGTLQARSLTTGASVSGYPLRNLYNPKLLHAWGGLSVNAGVLYVSLGGMCDAGQYQGQVLAIDVSGATPVLANSWVAVPAGVYGGACIALST